MPDNHPLVWRFGAFGDMVLITPLLKRLYERSGLPCDVIGTGAWTKTMFENMPWVRDVFTIGSRKTPYIINRGKKDLVRSIRANDYTCTWACELNRHSYQLLVKCRIPGAVTAADLPRHAGEHTAEHWLRLAQQTPAGCEYQPASVAELDTELFVTDDELDECRQWLNGLDIDADAPVICIQPGNKKTTRSGKVDRSSNTKYWPEKNWAAVIDELTAHMPDAHVLLCGVPAEYPLTREIFHLCRDRQRIHCVANDLPLRRLLALLKLSHSCISVDTGPAHAAAAVDCDVTVLFGKADARVCRPVSSRSKVVEVTGRIAGSVLGDSEKSWADCHDIQLITPEQVFAGWQQSLA